MWCTNCGREIPVSSPRFCPYCAFKLEETPPTTSVDSALQPAAEMSSPPSDVEPEYVAKPQDTPWMDPVGSSLGPSKDGIALAGLDVPSIHDALGVAPFETVAAGLNSISPGNRIGGYSISEGWFVKKKLSGGYDGFRATDIAWVFPTKRTRKWLGVVTTATRWKITLIVRPDRQIGLLSELGDSKTLNASAEHAFKTFQNLVPWAIFGFSQYRAECWKRDRATFLKVVDERIRVIRSAYDAGKLRVNADGSIVADEALRLPILTYTFLKNDKGKVYGRKYESSSSIRENTAVAYYKA